MQSSLSSLPYHDKPLSQEDRRRAMRIVEEEALLSTGQNNVDERIIPLPPSSILSERMQACVANAGKGEHIRAIDLQRYTRPSAPGTPNALLQAAIASEMLITRADNLELGFECSEAAWKHCIAQSKAHLYWLENCLYMANREVRQCNKARKLHHTAAGQELDALEKKIGSAFRNSIHTNLAVSQINRP
ncbi:splicing factor Cwf7 [Schizosaccharomyces japonicus yFS275]|uniref:Splicing factor Cwf7 n=1 Tax=Schizosaccharomyces japonicus (strain yFS275 / FY16936) TaxID=402676 RepID=B6K4Z6_SCHJY|nr:splicing factor Cwf7 [Schizosaccharomyces japonicus yFS275]EEB08553.2 splicing factor Cwf7 [Schizosaccharomyces japonicus yFS275]